jgi:hypothetical protein
MTRVYPGPNLAPDQEDGPPERLTAILQAVAGLIESQGGLIGHVKACQNLGSTGGVALSLVGNSVSRKTLPEDPETLQDSIKIALTAIIYGLTEKRLTDFLAYELDQAFEIPAEI